MERKIRPLSLVLILALVLVVVAPGVSSAAVKPAMIVKDTYEPDDTTATAKINPPVSYHTMTATDTDFSYVDVTATSTLLVRNELLDGWLVPMPQIFRYDPGTGAIASAGAPGLPFGFFGIPQTWMVHVTPGRYFVRSSPTLVIGAFSGAKYGQTRSNAQIIRVAGANRFGTAAAVSRTMYPMPAGSLAGAMSVISDPSQLSPNACIVATGRGFADALAAGAWAAKNAPHGEQYPILLTAPDKLSLETKAEIVRLSRVRADTNVPFTVYVLGSTAAVSDAIVTEIAGLRVNDWTKCVDKVERIGGATRFATAAMIASKIASSTNGIGDTAFFVNGFSYPDALPAAAVAARMDAPILLVGRDAIPPATADWLATHTISHAVVVGGPSVVSTAVMDALVTPSRDATRVAGPNRYETAAALARYGMTHGQTPLGCVLVTGENYPDGLSAIGISAFQRSPILLTRTASLSPAVTDFYADVPLMFPSYLVGGTASVSSLVESQFNAIPLPTP